MQGFRNSLWWISYLACLIALVCHCTISPSQTMWMHLLSQILVPLVAVNWTLSWEVSQWNQLGFVQSKVLLNMTVGTRAQPWVTTASSLTVLEHHTARKTEAVTILTWNIEMAPACGAATCQAYNTHPKAVRLLLWVQKILTNDWLFKQNHLGLICLMRKKKLNWTLQFYGDVWDQLFTGSYHCTYLVSSLV